MGARGKPERLWTADELAALHSFILATGRAPGSIVAAIHRYGLGTPEADLVPATRTAGYRKDGSWKRAKP